MDALGKLRKSTEKFLWGCLYGLMGGEPARYTGMKNVEMRVRRRNYVIDFSNIQVNISINVKFHPGRRDERNEK